MTETLYAADVIPSALESLGTALARHEVSAVVFDLDGTLADSAADLIEGVRRSFRHYNLGEIPSTYLPTALNGTMDGVMADACKAQGWPVPEDLSVLKARFVEEYAEMAYPTTRLYPGADVVLRLLRDAGIRTAVCTNSHARNATELLNKLGILSYVEFVCGADTFGIQKPSPVPLLNTLAELGVPGNQALYVGDSVVDALCAKEANVRFAWHEAGYGGDEPSTYPHLLKFQDWHLIGAELSLHP